MKNIFFVFFCILYGFYQPLLISAQTVNESNYYFENINKLGEMYEILINNLKIHEIEEIKNTYTSSEFGEYIIIKEDKKSFGITLKLLKKTYPIANVQPNYVYKSTEWISDSFNSVPEKFDPKNHWYLEMMDVPKVWKLLGNCENGDCGGDKNIIVAIIDTGVAYENWSFDAGSDYEENPPIKIGDFYYDIPNSTNLNGTFINGNFEGYERDFYKAPFFSEIADSRIKKPFDIAWKYFCELGRDGTEYECNKNEEKKYNHANDDLGHGTAIASTWLASNGSGNDLLIGMMNNVSLMPIRAFTPNDNSFCQKDNGKWDKSCNEEDLRGLTNTAILTESIRYAVDNGATIINMSLGGNSADDNLKEAIEYAEEQNVLIIAASGNEGSSKYNVYPSAYPEVLSVGAVNSKGKITSYSNSGDTVDVYAPAGETPEEGIIVQTYNCAISKTCHLQNDKNIFSDFTKSQTIAKYNGTSFAAPFATVLAVLLLSEQPDLSPKELHNLITNNAKGTKVPIINFETTLKQVIDDSKNDVVIPTDEKESLNALYRFWSDKTQTHFYTASQSERDFIIENYDEKTWKYEGIKMYVDVSCTSSDSLPVYRFWNNSKQRHFYTISEEIKTIYNLKSEWRLEGSNFCASKNESDEFKKPVYEFYSKELDSYFYTDNDSERLFIQFNLSNIWKFSSIVFYSKDSTTI